MILRKVVKYAFTSIPVDDRIRGDKNVQTMVEAYHAYINDGLAGLGMTLDSPVSRTGFALELSSLAESSLGDLAADALRTAATNISLAGGGEAYDFSVVASGVIRDNLYPGSSGLITFADIYNVLPLGISPDTAQPLPGYPLMSLYVTAPDLRNICEAALTLAPAIGSDYYLNFSGLKVEFNPGYAPYFQGVRRVYRYPADDFACENDAALELIIDLDAPYAASGLYRCVVDLYALQMMGAVTSQGLEIIPRDQSGVPINPEAYMDYRIDAGSDPGIQELKEWQALLQYLGGSFPSIGDGIPEDVYGAGGTALGRVATVF
ncbi:MAG: hypothetical protein BWY77_02001 [bacterium ADurb.Bin431]|nr:MAG: hypothetical protein BWY77_02001 [bacterium ADurb.Bin431]